MRGIMAENISKDNKNKKRLLVEAKTLRRYMKLGESAALLIREDRDARAQR